MPELAGSFREAVKQLHRRKDAAYGDAWKKRGELMSVVANIARKVDRLENVAGGAPPGPDESLLDTAVDLLVYLLKYEAYLADQSEQAALGAFDESTPQPYSDGVVAVEHLLDHLDLQTPTSAAALSLKTAAGQVVAAFDRIEACVRAVPMAPVIERLGCARDAADAVVSLIGCIAYADAWKIDQFIAGYGIECDAR